MPKASKCTLGQGRKLADAKTWAVSKAKVCSHGFQGGTRTNSWRPFTLMAFTLTTMLFITLLLLALVIYVLMESRRNGGILLAASIDEEYTIYTFICSYLPTLIVVLYTIAWGWIDLDVKRMEPYFQISRPGGSNAERSILTSYPQDYLPLVPFTAIRNRYAILTLLSKTILLSNNKALVCSLLQLNHDAHLLGYLSIPKLSVFSKLGRCTPSDAVSSLLAADALKRTA